MKIKKWIISSVDKEKVKQIQSEYGFTSMVAQTLCARGIDTFEKVENFLQTDINRLHNPILLNGMEQAVFTIKEAVKDGKKIVVFGDYDVDGVTATAVLVDYLRSIGADCDYYIPDRVSEGYGLSNKAMDELHRRGTQLIITVDSGITANKEALYANELGMSVVITDHHECHGSLPKAEAVVNHKRNDCNYPFKELAGVGVVFKLVCALSGDSEQMLERYSDLVAMGTVADVMPIVGENRIIVAQGLLNMQYSKRLGLSMLLQEAGQTGKKITSGTISFTLAPRINAAGRLGEAGRAVELFLTQDKSKACELASWLCTQNKKRQQAEAEILEQAVVKLRKEYNPIEDRVIVLAGENWHHGVIGIVSSRICDRYGMPTMLIAVDDGIGKGSGRSIRGFNLFEALINSSADLLEKFGGHELAAGLTIPEENIPELKRRLEKYAKDNVNQSDMMPLLNIDSLIEPEQITEENISGISILEPFGMGNSQPIFSMTEVFVQDITPISSDRHVRLQLKKDGYKFTAMLFGTGVGGCGFAQGNLVDIAFYVEINEYKSKKSVQLNLQDVRLSQSELMSDQKLLSIYNRFMNDQPLRSTEAAVLLPDRADLVSVWRHIISKAQDNMLRVPDSALSRRIEWESKREINIGKLFVCLDVFSESGLISYHFKDGLVNVIIKPHEGKADISNSVVLATLQSMSKTYVVKN